jgi:hypothetical protein
MEETRKTEGPELQKVKPHLSFPQVLETFRLVGLDLGDTPHHLSFFISFPEEDLLKEAAAFFDRVHARVFGSQQPGGTAQRVDEHTWQFVLGVRMRLEAEIFQPMEQVAETLAQMFGGLYEGWRIDTNVPDREPLERAMTLLSLDEGEA